MRVGERRLKMSKKYFGTDGFRGEAGADVTAELAFKVGRVLGWYYSHKKGGGTARAVIGNIHLRRGSLLRGATPISCM